MTRTVSPRAEGRDVRRGWIAARIAAFVAAALLVLPLPAAAGTGQGGRDSSSAAPTASAEMERSDGVPFTALDLAVLLGGATVVVGLGVGVQRFAREVP